MRQPECDVQQGRPRPAFLRALGRDDPPQQVQIGREVYERQRIYKHDSWAATALYACGSKRAICKFNRTRRLGLVPMRWLGRWLARRERRFLTALADTGCVPKLLGAVVVDGRVLSNAVAREFLPGHPIGAGEKLPEAFFDDFETLLKAVHRRGVAYVDLHKRENVLVGDDGKPYLIDFQISFAPPRGLFAWLFPWALWLWLLQRSDLYHLQKLRVRHQAALSDHDRIRMAPRPPWWIRWHRRLAVPFRTARRRLLVLLGVRTGRGRVTSEHFVEDGWRQTVRSG